MSFTKHLKVTRGGKQKDHGKMEFSPTSPGAPTGSVVFHTNNHGDEGPYHYELDTVANKITIELSATKTVTLSGNGSADVTYTSMSGTITGFNSEDGSFTSAGGDMHPTTSPGHHGHSGKDDDAWNASATTGEGKDGDKHHHHDHGHGHAAKS